jgi:hypothetical protein
MKKSGPKPPSGHKKAGNKLNIYRVHCLYWYEPLNKLTMKTSKLVLLTLLAVAMVFLSSCKEDDDPDVSPYVGDYVITKATISEALTLTTNEIGPIQVPIGTDITVMIQTALLGALQCESQNSLIQLNEDFSVYLYCTSSMNELDAGTWEEQSETVLVISLNSTAIPSSPTGMVLTVTEVSLVGSALTGTTVVPIPEAMLAEIVAALSQGMATLDTDATPDALPLTFTIELTKQ